MEISKLDSGVCELPGDFYGCPSDILTTENTSRRKIIGEIVGVLSGISLVRCDAGQPSHQGAISNRLAAQEIHAVAEQLQAKMVASRLLSPARRSRLGFRKSRRWRLLRASPMPRKCSSRAGAIWGLWWPSRGRRRTRRPLC